jgi:large subunit ribosomal protein L1
MAKHGKRYLDAVKGYNPEEYYGPDQAVELVKKVSSAKFDETIDVHMRLGIDPRHAEQQIRGVILMPAGLGKTVRILVFAEGDAARYAEEGGADIIGSDELVTRIEKEGFTEFDVAIAVPDMMRKIGKLGKVLGPRGLMPSPKGGTVVQPEDLPRVIEESRAGRIEFRNDRTGNLHVPLGKSSFTEAQLMANFSALMDELRRMRPSSVKGQFVRKVVLTPTHGPGVRVDPFAAIALTPTELEA